MLLRATKRARAKPTAEIPADVAQWIHDCVTIEDPQQEPSIIPFHLWPAQVDALAALEADRQLIILKARQLGITWLVLARELWRCIHHANKAVIVISKDQPAANEMIRRVRGMWMRLGSKPGGVGLAVDNVAEISWTNGSRIKAFASTSDAGSSFTGSMLVLDELAKNPNADDVWTSAQPTINDGGECVILSTAKGQQNLFYKLWDKAAKGENYLRPVFIPWHARPGRDADWYARTAADAVSMAHHMQEYPATPDEAFQQLADTPFLPSMSWWDACAEALPPLTRNEPCVIGLDAGVKDDNFGLVMVTRHPTRHDDVAVRHVQVWKPSPGKPVDIRGEDGPRNALYAILGSWNVIQVAYDPSQLLDLAGDLARDGRVYVSEFGQGSERLQSDRLLHDLILQRRIAHPSDADLTAHIANADAKLDTDGRRMRIVKREQSLKVDLCVSLSMAAKRCLDLNL